MKKLIVLSAVLASTALFGSRANAAGGALGTPIGNCPNGCQTCNLTSASTCFCGCKPADGVASLSCSIKDSKDVAAIKEFIAREKGGGKTDSKAEKKR